MRPEIASCTYLCLCLCVHVCAELALMRPGSLLINCARGPVIDKQVCVRALSSVLFDKQVRGRASSCVLFDKQVCEVLINCAQGPVIDKQVCEGFRGCMC